MKKIITISTICFLALPALALAQGEPIPIQDDLNAAVQGVVQGEPEPEDNAVEAAALQNNNPEQADGQDEEEVTASELGVADPKVLPNSPWYWVKSLWRSMKLWVTLDPVKRAEKRLEIANERLVEIKKLADAGTITEEQLEKILDKYDKEIEKLQTSLEKIKDKTEERADQLLNKLTKQEFIRQRLLQQLETKVQIKAEVIERVREKSLERLGQILDKIDEEKIEEKINNVFSDSDPLELKNLHNLQVLEQLKTKVSEQAQAAILKAQTNALKRLGESFREMSFDEKVEKVKEFLESPTNATTTEKILEQTEAAVNNSLPLLTNIINQAEEKIKAKIQEKKNGSDESQDDQGETEAE